MRRGELISDVTRVEQTEAKGYDKIKNVKIEKTKWDIP